MAVAIAVAIACPAAAWAHPGYSREIETLSERIADAPDAAIAARVRRAELLRRDGHLRAAAADLRVVLEAQPEHRAARFQRALVLIARRRDRAALTELDFLLTPPADATAGDPRHSGEFASRAELHARAGRLAAARRDYDEALARHPTPELALARAEIDVRREDLDAAAAGYREVLPALRGAVVVRLALVDLERRRGAPRAAIAELDLLLRASPQRPDWWLLRGELLDDAEDPKEALGARLTALAYIEAAVSTRPTKRNLKVRAQVYRALGAPLEDGSSP